jgi:aminomethyltransferase
MAEHRHCRASAALFDVSHMGQVRLVGADAAAALETLVPVDVVDLPWASSATPSSPTPAAACSTT